jgi:uncharacterized membrane protein
LTRRRHLDWLRGVAVLAMIEWHALDAWTVDAVRDTTAFYWIGFIGGWAAPLFLFLAGAAVPLAGAARVARGATPAAAGRSLMSRGWQIFAIAHLFRLQSFLFNGARRWSGVLKPDILNILGLGLVAVSWCWRRTRAARRQEVIFLAIGLALVLVTPHAARWWWPTLLYPRFEAYVRPVGNLGVFALFPWTGYMFAGAWLGALMARVTDVAADEALHHRLSRIGVAVVLAGLVVGWSSAMVPAVLPWTSALSPFLLRGGGVLIALGPLRRWLDGRTLRWSPMLLFGRTSLFVYWVHVEIAYGFLSRPWHKALPLSESIVAFAGLTVLMIALAAAWQAMKSLARKSEVGRQKSEVRK